VADIKNGNLKNKSIQTQWGRVTIIIFST
jgi:hypothetical protein